MPAPTSTDVHDDPAPSPARAGRRRGVIAASVVAALVLGSLVWGGASAMQAVAAEREREAARVGALAQLLEARSESSELLAVSSQVMSPTDERAGSAVAPAEFDALQSSHSDLQAELARALARETPLAQITAQSRLLTSTTAALMRDVDDYARAAISHARDVRAAAPLAKEGTVADLDAAVAALSVARQGQPGSYSGRAALLSEVLATSRAVTESHSAVKAEQERLEAERRAAEEEAARRAASTSRPSLRDGVNDAFDAHMIAQGCTIISRSGDTTRWSCPDEDYDNF